MEAKSEQEIDELIRNVISARQLITDSLVAEGRPTRNVSGQVVCPVCGSTLGFVIASNGHCHAKCSTDKCLAWME